MKFLILLALVSRSLALNSRVVDGTLAADGQFPHQGSMRISGGVSHNCGCVLVDADYTLTAAHCAEGASVGLTTLHYGINQRSVDNAGGNTGVSAIDIHPGWINDGSQGFPNDIAVLTHDTTVDTSDPLIGTIRMDNDPDHTNPDHTQSACTISGWGRTCGSCALPDDLMFAVMDVLTNAECITYWNPAYINDGTICIIDEADFTSLSCNGDSGGPLQCQSGAFTTLAGITSWGATGCVTTMPAGYSRVGYFNGWVCGVLGAGVAGC